MDRKKFIMTCGAACLGGSALTTLLQSCAGSNYFAAFALEGNRIAIKKSEFVHPDNQKQRKYVLLKSEKYNFPICVYQTADNEYSALLLLCTHKGCELQPNGDFLICPCHGSAFSNKGVVQNPPAEENLKSFKTDTDDENLYVYL